MGFPMSIRDIRSQGRRGFGP